jgi:hypothetical protein
MAVLSWRDGLGGGTSVALDMVANPAAVVR